jgi:Chaperone of endosialidase
MKNFAHLFAFLIVSISATYAQVGINADNSAPLSSAQLDVKSTTKAFYPPRMTTAQKNAIVSPQAGAVVFDNTLNQLSFYNGSSWVAAAGSGLALPYNQSTDHFSGFDGGLFRVTNTSANGDAVALNGTITGTYGYAIRAMATNTNSYYTGAIYGTNSSTNAEGIGVGGSHAGGGPGVSGNSVYGSGVVGRTYEILPINDNSRGISGENASTNNFGVGVYGFHAGSGKAIYGYTENGWGVYGSSSTGRGVYGTSGINTGVTGISSSGNGIYGESGSGSGVVGKALGTNPNNDYRRGVSGESSSTTDLGIGVYGSHAGTGKAIHGYTENGWGVYGFSSTNKGVYGSSNSNIGVLGQSNSGPGGFFSSSSGNALITNSGNVGIGVTNPSLNADERVDINGRLRIRSTTSTAGVWFNNTANNIASANGAFYGMKTDTETGIWINDAWRFWVNSVGNATLLGTLTQSSDRRLKKDFIQLNNSLTDIYKLNGYHFRWIEEARNRNLQTGFIAQEVQKIFPELVQTDEKGFLSVNYIGLIPHLIEAVKELKNENNSLKLENNLIKTENYSYKNNQIKLESRMDKYCLKLTKSETF